MLPQRQLAKLRLTTARAFVRVITQGRGPQAYANRSMLRLSATLQGMGPLFRVCLTLQNTGKNAVRAVHLKVAYNSQLYSVDRPLLTVPILLPGVPAVQHINVRCISPDGGGEDVRIFASTAGSDSCVPLLSAIVSMPMCDRQDASS